MLILKGGVSTALFCCVNFAYCVGSKRVVFGTDWPYMSVEVEVNKVLKMGFNELELEDVYYRNAESFYCRGRECKMNIIVFRIDDRLIHGPIVTKWIKEAGNAKTHFSYR